MIRALVLKPSNTVFLFLKPHSSPSNYTHFSENVGKRQVKTPKYYFWELGLLTFSLNIKHKSQILRAPLVGSLFENLVVVEAMKAMTRCSQ